MIVIIKEGEGDYSDYHETVVATLEHGGQWDNERLGCCYSEYVESVKASNRASKKRAICNPCGFAEWLVAERGFTKKEFVDYCL